VLHALALMSAVETDPVDRPGAPDPELDADIVVYVFSAAPSPADRRVLAALPPQRTIAVLNKADAIGSRWSDAVAAAQQYSRELRIPVVPVVASLATRTRAGALTDADVDLLRKLATEADPALILAPDLFVAPGPDAAEREQLLRRWDLYGVACACAALRHDPDLAPQQLSQILHAASGIDALHQLLHRRYEQVSALRGGELLQQVARATCWSPISTATTPSGSGSAPAWPGPTWPTWPRDTRRPRPPTPTTRWPARAAGAPSSPAICPRPPAAPRCVCTTATSDYGNG
jgi:hypothetical protein